MTVDLSFTDAFTTPRASLSRFRCVCTFGVVKADNLGLNPLPVGGRIEVCRHSRRELRHVAGAAVLHSQRRRSGCARDRCTGVGTETGNRRERGSLVSGTPRTRVSRKL